MDNHFDCAPSTCSNVLKKKDAVPVSTAPWTTREGRWEGRGVGTSVCTQDTRNNTETPRTAATIETSTGTSHVSQRLNKLLFFFSRSTGWICTGSVAVWTRKVRTHKVGVRRAEGERRWWSEGEKRCVKDRAACRSHIPSRTEATWWRWLIAHFGRSFFPA